MRILLISDIHANFTALDAISRRFDLNSFDLILNGGDSLVYGPFPNQTIDWLREHRAVSILGNTDRHIISLLNGKTFTKPRKAEKRIMYGWTAAELNEENRSWLLQQPLSRFIKLKKYLKSHPDNPAALHMCHGSPADPDEFLFPDTPSCRFRELCTMTDSKIVTVGHSHTQFHTSIAGVHFINPGSVGRMFDGKLSTACGVVSIDSGTIDLELMRIPYSVKRVADEIERQRLPLIYAEMYLRGRKLN